MPELQPLGDQAVLACFEGEADALRFAAAVRGLGAGWLIDVVQAYATVAVFYDPEKTLYAGAAKDVRPLLVFEGETGVPTQGRLHQIPCCYELQLDLERVAQHTGLSADDVIRLHTGTEYMVFAVGFSPGFPYLGHLPAELSGVPRLPAPRVRVAAGSVGLTGRQTGVYPEERPGGWNLIGRTPLRLVDVADGYFPLRTGDRVRFVRIGEAAFRGLEGQRL